MDHKETIMCFASYEATRAGEEDIFSLSTPSEEHTLPLSSSLENTQKKIKIHGNPCITVVA